MNVDCLFCKIIKGDIPCCRLLETETLLAFLDLGPVNEGHALLVPRSHYATLLDLPPALGNDVVAATQRLGAALMDVTGAGGFNVVQNNFPPAGQVVGHVHWHVIPRFADDGRLAWNAGTYADQAHMNTLADRLRAVLTQGDAERQRTS